MKKRVVQRFLSLALSAAMVFVGLPSAVYAAEESSTGNSGNARAGETIDVGLYAKIESDYTSGWENLNGVNDEAFEPSSSNIGPGKGWGNWSQDEGSSHYLQYTWDKAITTDSFQVYWYDDGGGTRIPGSMKFQYQDDSGNWQDLEMKSNFNDVLKLNQYNTIEVASVTTKAIKFTMTVRSGAAANGVYRWKVNAPLTDEAVDMALMDAKDKLTLSSRMTSDTILPSELTNGVKVSWTENHPSITIENGKAVVTRGTSDVAGTMKAVLSLNGKSVEKSFNVTVPKKTDEIPDMLAKYDFSGMTGSLANGSTVADLSGHDNNATVKGSGVTVADKALVLPGGAYGSGAGYVQLPTGMFDNQNNLTISMWIQNDQGAMWTSAFFFGKDTNSYFMINPQNPSSQAAKMCVTWGGSQQEIGLAPGQNIAAGPYTGSEWTHYTAVITENNFTGYINGEKYNTYSVNNKISDMGTNLLSYIGKSEYGDPFFKGKVKNISIYSKAMSDAEAGRLYTDGLTEEEIAKNAADALEIPEVKNGILSTNVYDTVTLQKQQLSGLVTIEWKSDNEEIISLDGKVTAPAKNTKVKMTATVKVGAKEQTKVIDVLVLSKDSAAYSMTVDKEDTGIDISQELYGLFYEDINSSADGGLSPELVKNNSFQNYADGSAPENPATYGDQTSWKKYWTSSNASGFVVEQTAGLNEKNTNYAKLTGNQTLSNVGFTTMYNNTKPSIPIEKGMKYDFSMWMKADVAYAGKITVQVKNASDEALTDVKTLELKKDGKWNKISTVLTGSKKEVGKLVLTISGAARTDVIYADMISLASQDTYGYGNKNYAYGAGLRKDLVEVLADLSPSFIRFPGGCAIEGDYGPDSFYNWENSVGPLEERKAQASYWGDHTIWKNPDGDYGYMMSFELGYHEILTLCEDLGAEAFPIMSAGIYCQFAGAAPEAKKGAELDPYAQYAIDLLNYCWGDPNSSDPEQAKWAKKRVENGHAEPFDLHYVGIGNENWNTATVNYYENFTYIKNKIDAYKAAHYPDHQLQLIFAYGPYYWNASVGEDAYSYVKREMPGEVLMDEHYYAGAKWMLENTHRYDTYDRLDEKGTDVFVGEYAVNDMGNKLEGAIAEAAYMTGFERNGDIVRHASYAPLLAKEGATNWSPNMIYFNEYDVMKTPNYYVQWMYANNYGKKLVNTKLNQMNATGDYKALSDNQTDIYQVSSVDDDYIYLKLVNHDSYAKDIVLNYPGTEAKEAEIICMSGAADAENYMGNETVVPVTSKAALEDGKMIYQIPAMSVTIVKVANKVGTDPDPAKADKTKLQAAVDKAVPKADADKYTEETWADYEKALDDAKVVLADDKADQKAVDAAVKALADAKAALEEKPVKPEIPEVLADFNFDTDGDAFTGGNAKATGDYTLVDHNGGKALKLDGKGQHLAVTDKNGGSLLTGVKEMTISYQIKPENSATNWGFFAAPNDNTQNYEKEHYVGIVDISGTTKAERYNNTNGRPVTAEYATGYDGWYYVTVVHTEDATVLYINGEKVAEAQSEYALTDILGENSVLYIGRSNWKAEGEYATAIFDNYKILSKALTAEEVAKEAVKYVEKEALKEAIDAKVDGKDAYTAASWDVYTTALEYAKTVYEKADATQAEVDAAKKKLTDATAKLEKIGDKTELKKAIADAEKLDEAKYTKDSWKKVADALADAKKADADANATQAEVDAAKKALEKAVKDLEEAEKVDKSKLDEAVKNAVPDDKADEYTEETWDAYQKALNGAEKVLADEKADQAAVDAAEKTLADARAALKTKKLPYDDVEEGTWYYDAIAYNYYAGTMTGLKPDHFGPADTLVRAQFASVLHKMNSEVEVEYTDKFADVTKDDWFKNPVLWAAEKEIVTGYTGMDLFGANDVVTREQMATMMYRYAKNFKKYEVSADGDCSKFPDAKSIQPFAQEAMKWAVKEEIITGKTINGQLLLDPQGSANRAECATIIQRFLEKYEKKAEK